MGQSKAFAVKTCVLAEQTQNKTDKGTCEDGYHELRTYRRNATERTRRPKYDTKKQLDCGWAQRKKERQRKFRICLRCLENLQEMVTKNRLQKQSIKRTFLSISSRNNSVTRVINVESTSIQFHAVTLWVKKLSRTTILKDLYACPGPRVRCVISK